MVVACRTSRGASLGLSWQRRHSLRCTAREHLAQLAHVDDAPLGLGVPTGAAPRPASSPDIEDRPCGSRGADAVARPGVAPSAAMPRPRPRPCGIQCVAVSRITLAASVGTYRRFRASADSICSRPNASAVPSMKTGMNRSRSSSGPPTTITTSDVAARTSSGRRLAQRTNRGSAIENATSQRNDHSARRVVVVARAVEQHQLACGRRRREAGRVEVEPFGRPGDALVRDDLVHDPRDDEARPDRQVEQTKRVG